MNGVPTAYDDLESLLTNSENQLERSYKHLPSFLQDLIKKLPSKMTQSIGPEMLAAAAEKQGVHSKYMNKGAHAAEKMGVKVRVPSLKDLVTKPGAVAGLLKTIMNFLKLRFPAFLGMNVLYSLGLFGMFPLPLPKRLAQDMRCHTDNSKQSSSSSSGTVTNGAKRCDWRKNEP